MSSGDSFRFLAYGDNRGADNNNFREEHFEVVNRMLTCTWTLDRPGDAPLGGLRTRRQATAAGRAYKAMLDLGIAALPLVVQRLRMGETCFIPIFEELTGSGASVHGPNAEATRRNCMAWWERNRHDWVIPQP